MFRPVLFLSVLPWALAAPTAGAQSSETLERVQVQGQAQALGVQTGALKRVVDADELLRMGDTRLVEALRRLPGLSVEPGRPGQPEQLSLRGLGASRTQLLLNGRRVAPGFSLDEITPEQVARIEILQGSSAAISGEALAGSVNIVLKPAPRQDLRRLQAGLGHAQGGERWRLQSQRGGPLAAEGWSQALTTSLQQRRWRLDFDDEETMPDAQRRGQQHHEGHVEQWQLAPQLAYAGEGGQRLEWQNQFELARLTRQVDYAMQTLSGAASLHPQHEEQYRQWRRNWRSELQGRWNLAPGWQLQGSAGLNGQRQHSDFADQGPDLDDRTRGRLAETGTQAAASLDWDAAEAHSLSLGLAGSRQRRAELRDQLLDGQAVSRLDLRAAQTRAALYLQDEWALSDRQQLSLGWRQERLLLRSEDLRQAWWLGLPSLQWQWRRPEAQWRLGLARSFRAPTLAQLQPRPYTSSNNSMLDPDLEGSPSLRPERAWALDLQAEPRLGAGQTLRLGGFVRRIHDPMVVATRWRVGSLGTARWIRSPFNAPRAWAAGLEAELRWALAGGLSLDAQATRTLSRVQGLDGGDLQLAELKPLSAQLGLQGPAGAGGSWRASYAWRSGGWLTLAPGEQRYTRPGGRLDLSLQRALAGGWRLTLTLEGLLQASSLERSVLDADGQRYLGTTRSAATRSLQLGLQGSY